MGQERQCLLGRDSCSDETACAAHADWKAVSQQVCAFFQETTVADLLLQVGATPLRMAL